VTGRGARRALATVGLAAAVSCARTEPVATAVVTRGDFVREVVAEGTLRARRSTPLNAPVEAEGPLKVAWLAADGSRVGAGDVVARFDDVPWRLARQKAEDDIASVDARVTKHDARARAGSRAASLDAELARRERELAERFLATDEGIFSRHDRIESAMDARLARDRERHATSTLEVRERVARGEGRLLALERGDAERELDRARAGLDALSLAAPHAGLVVFRRDWRMETIRPGDTVWPGQPVAEIPDLAEMEAEVWVLEADAGGLAVGAKARIELDSVPDRLWQGEVARVDKVAKPRQRHVAVQYFGATVKLEATEPAVMKPGQRIRARIEIERRPGVLTVPLAALGERDGAKVVRRRRGGEIETVEIEVLGVGGGMAAVGGGVEEGDIVLLGEFETAAAAAPAGPAANGTERPR
jgi:multidrug resistance efflux pump